MYKFGFVLCDNKTILSGSFEVNINSRNINKL